MKKIAIILFVLFYSCSPQKKTGIIDENIEEVVLSKTKNSEFSEDSEDLFFYETVITLELYENDALEYKSPPNTKTLFRSFYYEKDGAMYINGAYGMFDGFGFSIKIKDQEATVYALLGGEAPNFSLTEGGERKARLEVPSIKSKLTLSKYPEQKENDPVYGYVEFESQDFYSGLEGNNQTKQRMNMKVYFKAILTEL